MRRPLRIATTSQLERSVRAAGFEPFLLPKLPNEDFNRSIRQRMSDGPIYREFLEKQNIELVIDHNAAALTLLPLENEPNKAAITTAALGIPHVAGYLDPVTSTMAEASWMDHWHLLESQQWIKWIWETAHAEELQKLGVPNVLTLSMAAADDDFDTAPLPEPDPGSIVAFMGHPATSWFRSNQSISTDMLFAGLLAAGVHADMPEVPFHSIYFDLYGLGRPAVETDTPAVRAENSRRYFDQKFIYNAYLALKQRDRFAIFLKKKLGDAFELIGDHWETNHGLAHTPRIWDKKVLHERMRRVPICLNLMKGCLETGLNIRHFEITAYGGFMLTYWTPELPAYFEIGKECDVFRDEGELVEKIDYYLDHPRERREIALAGQRRTHAQHLYSHRIGQLVDTLRAANVLARSEPAMPPGERFSKTSQCPTASPSFADAV